MIVQESARQILDQVPEALLVMDASGRVQYVNPGVVNLTGFAVDELVGEPVTKLLPPSSRRRLDVVAWLARWAGDPNPDQLRYLSLEGVSAAGETKWYRVRVSAFTDTGADAPSYLIVLRDVTEETETLQHYKHEQLLSNRILAIGDDGVLSIDSKHRITLCNLRACEIFGVEPADVLGKPIDLLLPEQHRSGHGALINTFVASDVPSRLMGQRGEVVGLHKDGTEIPLEVSITKTRLNNELVVSAQIRDITERKQRERALKDSENRFRALFENALEAMCLMTDDGTVVELNQAARKLLPEGAAFEGVHFWNLDWWQRGEAAASAGGALAANVEAAAAGQQVRTRVHLQRGDADIELDFSLTPVPNADGDIGWVLAEARVLEEDA